MEDIKPIDKFTLDKYVKEEDDLLEYVEMLGCKCHPDYDFIRVKKEIEDRTETNETEVATEQQATEQQAAAAEEEEEEEEEEIVVGNPEKDEEPVIVPEAPEMPESEQLELPEVTVEPAQSAEVSMKIETNTASTPILAERIKTAGDLRRSISLNDSFRFSRELFGGSMEQMNHVLQQIGEMHSLDAALVFLSSKIKVEEENEAKADLVELLKKYFI